MYRLLLAIFTLFSCLTAGWRAEAQELPAGYITVVDQAGGIIFQTGLEVHPGDEYIDEDNRLYEIISVEDKLARARYARNETVSMDLPEEVVPAQAPVNGQPVLIAIYHTHSDEAYTPTDGKPTVRGNGSIMKVGAALSQQLNTLGYQTIHNTTLHEPHDANAYYRSRRTAVQLLRKKPTALFDIHRDSAPLSAYKTTVNGQDAAKILLVVGRQNQNRMTTLNYVKKIKAAVDSKYKGLIRGVFIAHGNYNQDLMPRAVLLEIGTQYNTLEAAQRSAALFADAVPLFLAPKKPKPPGQPEAAGEPDEPEEQETGAEPVAYSYDILSIAGLLLIGTVAFMFLSTGSWQEAKNKLTHFKNKEFGDLLKPFKKKKE